jgi:hypothetical protein
MENIAAAVSVLRHPMIAIPLGAPGTAAPLHYLPRSVSVGHIFPMQLCTHFQVW